MEHYICYIYKCAHRSDRKLTTQLDFSDSKLLLVTLYLVDIPEHYICYVCKCAHRSDRKLTTQLDFIMLGVRNELGPEPIAKLEHLLGEFALQMLVFGLAITPLRRIFGINLFKFRRAIGLIAFGYVLLHVLTWALLDLGDLNRVWADIMKRPYITIGMLALLGLIPLALTSNNFAQRRLGARPTTHLRR